MKDSIKSEDELIKGLYAQEQRLNMRNDPELVVMNDKSRLSS